MNTELIDQIEAELLAAEKDAKGVMLFKVNGPFAHYCGAKHVIFPVYGADVSRPIWAQEPEAFASTFAKATDATAYDGTVAVGGGVTRPWGIGYGIEWAETDTIEDIRQKIKVAIDYLTTAQAA